MLSRNPMVDTEFLAPHLDKYLLRGEMKICKLSLARLSFLHHWKGSHPNTDLTQSRGGHTMTLLKWVGARGRELEPACCFYTLFVPTQDVNLDGSENTNHCSRKPSTKKVNLNLENELIPG